MLFDPGRFSDVDGSTRLRALVDTARFVLAVASTTPSRVVPIMLDGGSGVGFDITPEPHRQSGAGGGAVTHDLTLRGCPKMTASPT